MDDGHQNIEYLTNSKKVSKNFCENTRFSSVLKFNEV